MIAPRSQTHGTWLFLGDGDLPFAALNYEFSLVFIDLDHFKEVNDTHGAPDSGPKLLAGNRQRSEDALPLDRLRGFVTAVTNFVILLPQTFQGKFR